MVFWAGIIVSGLFVLWAIRKGFYETWVMLFNSIISIYLALYLRSTVSDYVPAVADSAYSNALVVLLIFVAAYAILTGLSYIFFTSQFDVPFPVILDYIGSGIIGFFNGLLLWSFLCLLISLTPLGQNEILTSYGFGNNFQASNITYINKFITPVNSLVSSRSSLLSTNQVFKDLIKPPEIKRPVKPSRPTFTNEPNESNEPKEPNKPMNTGGSTNRSNIDSNSQNSTMYDILNL